LNLNEYYRKVYTVAFRLTGDEMKAGDIAFIAIKSTSSALMLSENIPAGILQRTAGEVCRLFLSGKYTSIQVFKRFDNNNSEAGQFQDALMVLSPAGRAAVVWRDVLGFKISDMAEAGYTKQELYSELNSARKQMKEIFSDMTIYGTGA